MSVDAEKAERTANLPTYVEPEDLAKAQAQGVRHSCDQLRFDLKTCLLATDCCKSGRVPSDCLRSRDPSVPDECRRLSYQFFECKRSLIDMRTRFRGRKYDD